MDYGQRKSNNKAIKRREVGVLARPQAKLGSEWFE
jgi:hypothetical protein